MSTARTIIEGLYDAFAKGDVPAVLGAMDEAIEWNEAEGFVYADGNPYRGPNAVLEGIFVRLGQDWDDFRVAPGRFTADDDTVVVEGRYTGTHKTTGRPVDAQFAHVWRVRDGKVVSFQQYTDTAQFRNAVEA